MKGIVLAGGLGTRLAPLTLATNKHLLPVYDRPMVFYPIQTLVRAGVTEVMVVVSGPHSGDFIPILRNGEDLGCRIYYGFQEKPNGGIADALGICEAFAGGGEICVILGDNTTDADISEQVKQFRKGQAVSKIPQAHLFLRQVSDPHRFGVATLADSIGGSAGGGVIKIVEKPAKPETNLAVTGLYLYDRNVFNLVKECEPSGRGELEITDVNNLYIERGIVTYSMLDGFWKDAGTFDSLFEAGEYWRNKASRRS
jgi:glucose-1-phosphate thymidylyltransferase